MKENHNVIFWAWLIFVFVFLAMVSITIHGEEGTPIPSTPFIPLERNGEEGFWMNLETAKKVAWAMSMVPEYSEGLEEAAEIGEVLDVALDTSIENTVERDREIETLKRVNTGLWVSNIIQAILNGGGIFIW